MKIAIIGAGISGLVCAHLLSANHEVTVFEAGDHAGGHAHTHAIDLGGTTYHVDSGFIVCNDRTYPNFLALLQRLEVATQPSTMSFSVRCDRTGLEYCGTSPATIFAQPWNLFRPAFLGMLRDIVRFNRESRRFLAQAETEATLADFLAPRGYGREFIEHYLIPIGAAVWSADPRGMLGFPARTFLRFFENHGFLQVRDLPQWRTVTGGSQRYVERLTQGFRARLRLRCPVARVMRGAGGVDVKPRDGEAERYDEVVMAAHSDEALGMLADATPAERAVLGAIPYQENEAVLHTDVAVLPRARRAWASWNYRVPQEARGRVAVTYNMNLLQSLSAPETFCVTLNPDGEVDPGRVLARMRYHHPVYTRATVAAQKRHGEISGVHRTHYCGAYWGYGFHEDGVNSALAVCRRFGVKL